MMGISNLLKRFCVAFALLILLACGGGGGDDAPAPAPAPAPTPNISLSQTSHDFAGVVLDRSADRTFVIQNTGPGTLRIGTISSPSSPFSISSDTCSGAALATSATCSVRARFSPQNQGSFSGTISISSDDPDASTKTISLSGQGYGLSVWINKIDAVGCQVNADITVTNPRSGSLLTLSTADFTLRENGVNQSITALQIENPSYASLVLALDWSVSTMGVIGSIRTAAKTFISLLTNTDQAAICKFRGIIGFSPPLPEYLLAGDDPGLTAYVDAAFSNDDLYTNLGTRFYDAVYDSIERATHGTNPKRAVIVLSDGADEASDGTFPGSAKTLDEVILYATQQGIPVFTIFYVDPAYSGGGFGKPEIMQRIATETGGQYYNSETADLAAIFQQISNTLSNKYTINYTSSTCSGAISLDVRADWTGLYGRDSKVIRLP